MNALHHAIKAAYDSSGNTKEVNKAYLEFIKANFIVPLEADSDETSPKVLFLEEKNNIFLPVFTKISLLNAWASSIKDNIKLLKLSGVDLLKGIGEYVSVSLDIGSAFYKEFNPQEIARMRSMVLKLL